jgi:hypothetical protein
MVAAILAGFLPLLIVPLFVSGKKGFPLRFTEVIYPS